MFNRLDAIEKRYNELSEEFSLNEEKEIPKYRALYLDSLKSSKYHIIKTDSLFQKLFLEYSKEKGGRKYGKSKISHAYNEYYPRI